MRTVIFIFLYLKEGHVTWAASLRSREYQLENETIVPDEYKNKHSDEFDMNGLYSYN